jgi:hypothetical protein
VSRAWLAKALLSVLLVATTGVIARFAGRNRETIPLGAASTPSGGGANQASDKAEKSKRAISDYVVVGGLVVSIVTLGFNQLRTGQDLETTRQNLQLTQQGQFSERYAHTIEELGSERVPIRLTGIYELEQVALASPEHYQLGMEILVDRLARVVAQLDARALVEGDVVDDELAEEGEAAGEGGVAAGPADALVHRAAWAAEGEEGVSFGLGGLALEEPAEARLARAAPVQARDRRRAVPQLRHGAHGGGGGAGQPGSRRCKWRDGQRGGGIDDSAPGGSRGAGGRVERPSVHAKPP